MVPVVVVPVDPMVLAPMELTEVLPTSLAALVVVVAVVVRQVLQEPLQAAAPAVTEATTLEAQVMAPEPRERVALERMAAAVVEQVALE